MPGALLGSVPLLTAIARDLREGFGTLTAWGIPPSTLRD